MNTPPGYTEQDVLNILDALSHQLARTFTFGYYELEDIEQEIKVIALEGMGGFDPNRGTTLYTFLRRHVHNRLCNLKRDKYYRRTPPCTCCDATTPENNQCAKYRKWLKANTAKRNLVDTAESHENIEVHMTSIPEALSQAELRQFIDIHLPVDLRGDYCKFLDGVKLPKKRLLSLLKTLKEILGYDYRA